MRPEIQTALTRCKIADVLEPFVDVNGLANVLDALAFLCAEKAEHVRVNWQDEATEKVWDDMADQILGVEFKARRDFL